MNHIYNYFNTYQNVYSYNQSAAFFFNCRDKKKQSIIPSCHFSSTSLSFMASNTERYPADVFNTWRNWTWLKLKIWNFQRICFFHSQRWKIQGRTGWIFQLLFETTRLHGVSRSLIKLLVSMVNRTNCNGTLTGQYLCSEKPVFHFSFGEENTKILVG